LDTTAPATRTITIGGLFSLTGNWATLGVTSKAAMDVGIEDVSQYLAAGSSGLQFVMRPVSLAAAGSPSLE
jgi:hypothetical protein